MLSKLTIQLKAFFLLAVFSLNTLLGFACSIGIDLGYNSHHHQKDKSSNVADEHHCDGDATRQEQKSTPPGTDDCCKDGVLKFNLADKTVSSSVKLDAPVLTVLNIVAFYFVHPWTTNDLPSNHYYVRSDHPPISTDIRVSIQSFQI